MKLSEYHTILTSLPYFVEERGADDISYYEPPQEGVVLPVPQVRKLYELGRKRVRVDHTTWVVHLYLRHRLK